MVSYDLLLLMLKIETSTPGTNSIVFRPDHLWSTSGIICGPILGSFAVWGSFAVGDHLWRCTGLRNRPFLVASLMLQIGLSCDNSHGLTKNFRELMVLLIKA